MQQEAPTTFPRLWHPRQGGSTSFGFREAETVAKARFHIGRIEKPPWQEHDFQKLTQYAVTVRPFTRFNGH